MATCSKTIQCLLTARYHVMRYGWMSSRQWRTFSTESKDSSDNIKTITSDDTEEFKGSIPQDKLSIRYIRGGGPGGQNVNKLNTKVEIRFNLQMAEWLPTRVKNRIEILFKPRINKTGELIVTSHKYRTQTQNLQDALNKLETFIKEASEIPCGPSELTRERIKLLKRKSERRRLVEKKYQSVKKSHRETHNL